MKVAELHKIWIDEKASEDQKRALDKILKGELEGKPWGIFSHTVDKWLDTTFVPVELKMDGSKSSYKAGHGGARDSDTDDKSHNWRRSTGKDRATKRVGVRGVECDGNEILRSFYQWTQVRGSW